MPSYEYKVVPAPKRGLKAKGVKSSEARFAHALETVMNELGAEGWEYQRTDTLPSEERSGLTSKTTVFQNMLVFRRAIETAEADVIAPAVVAATPVGHTSTDPASEANASDPEVIVFEDDLDLPKHLDATIKPDTETGKSQVAAE